ncbi:hypothetical protein M9Y10_015930 [Tritrichomonas musculus]|uniref:Uncharacterized protein n=1 Tax=Tritrichomonas musculus TaxID=1915356 RepID=A0ABR2I7U2_9EUKA
MRGKNKSKWRTILVLQDNLESLKINLDEHGMLPKNYYSKKRKSRVKDYTNTLGTRAELYGNYKDPPDTTSKTNTTNNSSQKIENYDNLQKSKSQNPGQKEIQSDDIFPNSTLLEKGTVLEDQLELFPTNYDDDQNIDIFTDTIDDFTDPNDFWPGI